MFSDIEKQKMEYLGMEYNSLRNEIIERINLITQLEIFSMTAIGIIWGWAFSAQLLIPLVWIGVGAAIVILSTAFFVAFETEGIFRMGTYISAKFEANPDFGISWETSNVRMSQLTKAENVVGGLKLTRHSFYYLVLIMINLLISTITTIAFGSISNIVSITGITIVGLITLLIYLPIRRIELVTRTRQEQIDTWKKVL